ncbi:MAG: YggT family protein [Actinobacteria bacterium]|nr:YggT family protein [Actinomycetota bacterium]
MELICYLLFLYNIILIVRVIFSWVEAFQGRIPDGIRPVYGFVYSLTEPPLRILRRYVPPAGMFDTSFLVLILIIIVLQRVVCA